MALTYIETYGLSQQTRPDLYLSTNLKMVQEVVFCYLSNHQSSSTSISSLYRVTINMGYKLLSFQCYIDLPIQVIFLNMLNK